MDNLTHSLIGLAAAKSGLEKLSPGTTILCILAANAPDADIAVLPFAGRWEYLQHHRGITHSIVGALTLAILLPLAFYLVEWTLSKTRNRARTVKLKGLLLASVIVTATHPIMDWTNNYGMRFLLPWNPRWFYGDFVFVIDPFIWLVLGSAAFLLTSKTRKQLIVWIVLGLITTGIVLFAAPSSMMLAGGLPLRILWILTITGVIIAYRLKLASRVGARIGIAALGVVLLYGVTLAGVHVKALRQARAHATLIAQTNAEHIVKVAAMPMLANPLDWQCVMETERATYRFSVSFWKLNVQPESLVRFEKPSATSAEIVSDAARDRRAEIFLGFARFPVMRVVGEDCATQTLVQFADLRYTEPGRVGRGTFAVDVPVECPELNR